MSKLLVGYLLVTGLAASRAGGQELEYMRGRLDSTVASLTRARQALIAYRKSTPMRYDYADSAIIARGKVKIYFDKPMSELARQAATEADRQLLALGGALDRAPNFTFSIAPDSQRQVYGEALPMGSVDVRRHMPNDPRNPKHTSTERTVKDVTYALVAEVTDATTMNWPLRGWTFGAIPIAPGTIPPTNWGEIRLTVVSSVSHLGRDCFNGDIKACRLYLALDSVADPARTLFDSVGRSLVVKYEADHAYRVSRPDTRSCLNGDDRACIRVVDAMQFSSLASPFVRASVVAQAIRLGGDKAVERMSESRGRPAETLAAAAGAPLDSLIADWQRHLGDRAGGRQLPWPMAVSSLLWIVVCVILAHRGTRWR